MHVVNSDLELLQSIDWDKLEELAYQETVGDKKRQHNFKDVGTTGGQCPTCTGSSVGVAKPGKKPGSTDPCIVQAMMVLSHLIRQAKPHPFNCDDQNNPRNKFARRIDKGCCMQPGRSCGSHKLGSSMQISLQRVKFTIATVQIGAHLFQICGTLWRDLLMCPHWV
jgi:hypothetical protein